MKFVNGWIVFEDRDIVNLSIDVNIQVVEKHFVLVRNRSFLHSEVNCLFCAQGIVKRTRYVARCIYNGQSLNWEFGGDVYRKIKTYLHGDLFVNLSITRIGTGTSTDYAIEEVRSFGLSGNAESAREIWHSALSSLQTQVSKANYDTWLKATEGMDFDGYVFVVKTPSSFVSDYLQNRLMSLVENALSQEIKQVVKVRFYTVSQHIPSYT